ncbi:hypothetical protein BU24DRAFT_281524 [Aaosphaeria arxii CBS 175.79]|uniref:Uncharacterized protein n=1 Tax=Aaosphaeria arxii CBS 175.79 TaxID=1450172 RepID=A0A6A5XEW1_9PLEO|nr:uncharacterized protein BU24DRAFT_281524 [Aaosphaeria arxii CBS 175.79]KAF2011460.1 hypothetical protein BU24DRAFT_281524 [Aaosphaeria arxii CBS 175.79]
MQAQTDTRRQLFFFLLRENASAIHLITRFRSRNFLIAFFFWLCVNNCLACSQTPTHILRGKRMLLLPSTAYQLSNDIPRHTPSSSSFIAFSAIPFIAYTLLPFLPFLPFPSSSSHPPNLHFTNLEEDCPSAGFLQFRFFLIYPRIYFLHFTPCMTISFLSYL